MKRIISKILIILIIFLLLIDFVFASQYRISYAAGPTKTFIDGVTNLGGGIVGIIYTLLKALIVGVTFGVQVLTTVTASAYGINTEGNFWEKALDTITPITPIDIFFNKYKLLDINFFDFSGLEEDSFIYLFRVSVAEWYTIMKLIACAILLVILVYVGIRMAISTIADDRAKYKKMLADWAISLVLIFTLQYIIIFTVACNDAIVSALESAFADSDISGAASESILGIGLQGIIGSGIISFSAVLVYVIIVMQTIMFLLAYLKRMIKIGFLIIISPLISITYSIDKMGDGKAQALGNWLREFVFTILIQPFHCIIYLALVQTAINLLTAVSTLSVFSVSVLNSAEYNQLAAGVLAIMCLKFVNDGEKIVRKIFGFKDDGSTGFGAGAALGLAAIANAGKIGKAARVGVNGMNDKYKRLAGAAKTDFGKFKNSKAGKWVANSKVGTKAKQIGTTIGKGTSAVKSKTDGIKGAVKGKVDGAKNAVKSKTDGAKRWVSNTKAGKFVKKAAEKANEHGALDKAKTAIKGATSNVGKYMKDKASLSTALGVMGAAMAFSSGEKSTMDAIATGTAVNKGAQEFFASSDKTQNEDTQPFMEEYEENFENDLIENVSDGNGGTKKQFTEKANQTIAAYETKDEAEKKKAEAEEKKEEAKKEKKKLEEEKINAQGDQNKVSEIDRKIADQDKIIDAQDDIIEAQDDIIEAQDKIISANDLSGDLKGIHEGEESKYMKNTRASRWKQYSYGANPKSLESTANQIIQKLLKAKQISMANQTGQKDYTLTIDDITSANACAQALMNNISLGVKNKKGFGPEAQQKLITSQLGLDADGTNYLYRGVNDSEKDQSNLQDDINRYTSFMKQNYVASSYSYTEQYNETKNKELVRNRRLLKQIEEYEKHNS